VLDSGSGLVPGAVQRVMTLSAAVSESLYSLACVIEELSLSGGAGFLDLLYTVEQKGSLGGIVLFSFCSLRNVSGSWSLILGWR